MLISIPPDQLVRPPYAEVRAAATDRTAVSEPACSVRKAARSAVSELEVSRWFFGARLSLITELLELGRECAAPNWDGYSARPIDALVIWRATTFVRSLPRDLPVPDVAPAPDGSITFEWLVGQHRRFIVSVAKSDRMAYAWLDGTDSGHGVARFAGGLLPRLVVEAMRAVGVNGNA